MKRHAFDTSPRRHRHPFAVALAWLAASSLTACGISGENLFGGRTSPSEGQGGTGASGGAPVGSGGESAAESVAASTAEQSASSVAQSSSAAQSVASVAQSSSGEGGGPPTGVVVWCKNSPCEAGQVCCFHLQDPNQDTCGTSGQCGGGFIQLSCSGPADCPGEVCCGDWVQFYTDVSCQPSCTGQDVTLCTGDPSVCPGSSFCDGSDTLGAGYDVCKTN